MAWHIGWQAAMGRDLLGHGALFERIRRMLIAAHQRPGRVLIDYLLAPSEVHVVSTLPPDRGPGDIARALASVIARSVRETDAVRGPVFAGPYRAHPLTSEAALMEEIRLLAWRPVALGACAVPCHYAHSALRTTLGLRPAMGYDARPLLGRFGGPVPVARAAMRRWLAQRPTTAEMRQWELSRGLILARGDVGPRPAMSREVRGPAATLVAAHGAQRIEGALCLLERWVRLRVGLPGTEPLALLRNSQGVRARALVACLAVDMDLCSAASVARHFGRAKATLSEQMADGRRRAQDRLILAMPLQRVAEEAASLAMPSS